MLREPLVHFFILGAGIFLLSALVGESDDPLDEIVVSAGQIERSPARRPELSEVRERVERK